MTAENLPQVIFDRPQIFLLRGKNNFLKYITASLLFHCFFRLSYGSIPNFKGHAVSVHP